MSSYSSWLWEFLRLLCHHRSELLSMLCLRRCSDLRFPFWFSLDNVDRSQSVDIFETMGQFVDGLKFTGGSYSLMPRSSIKEYIDIAHKHDIYVSTGDWAEHMLREGPTAFKQYVEDCRDMGFDTIELNVSSLKVPEEALLRFIRTIKSLGLKAKPLFALKIDPSDIPADKNRAFGAYILPSPRKYETVEDVDLLVRKAERCLEAGADMIMIDADDICTHSDALRTDVVAKIIGRLGLERTMFEVSGSNTTEWFVKRYGPRVNLFIDHSDVMNLECLRGYDLGNNRRPLHGSMAHFLW